MGKSRSAQKRGIRGQHSNGSNMANPLAALSIDFQNTLVRVMSPDDLEVICCALVFKARSGETWAIREVLDRVLGRPLSGADTLIAQAKLDARQIRLTLVDQHGKPVPNRDLEGDF